MENNININRSSISTQPESVEEIRNKKPAEQEEIELPVYPENPEAEQTFRGEEIAPVEEGLEPAPLAEDIVNDPWNETSNFTVDNMKMPGDQMDEYYEKLGRQAERNANTLDKNTYQSIPAPQK